MWDLLYEMQADTDFLQVFDLFEKDGVQHIIHCQEYPKWHIENIVLTESAVTEKVYILVEPGLETMILAEEYLGD